MKERTRHKLLRTLLTAGLLTSLLALSPAVVAPSAAHAYTPGGSSPTSLAVATAMPVPASASTAGGSLESVAKKAGQLGRKVAMSLIALGFAIAAVLLVFRRDFKEAAGVFAVGLLAIVLATPAGVNVLHGTVNSLFGAS